MIIDPIIMESHYNTEGRSVAYNNEILVGTLILPDTIGDIYRKDVETFMNLISKILQGVSNNCKLEAEKGTRYSKHAKQKYNYIQELFGIIRNMNTIYGNIPFIIYKLFESKCKVAIKDRYGWMELKNFYPEQIYMLVDSIVARNLSWATLSNENLDWILKIIKGREVIEIGGGNGYYTWILNKMGANITSFDIKPKTTYLSSQQVKKGSHKVLKLYKKEKNPILLMIWPANNKGWVEEFQGNEILYIGDPKYGDTGTYDFFKELKQNWSLKSSMYLPYFVRHKGEIFHYIKKD